MSEAAETHPAPPDPLIGIAIVFMENGALNIGSLDGMQKTASQEDVVALCNMVLLNHQVGQLGAMVQQGARGRVIVPENGRNPINRIKALFRK